MMNKKIAALALASLLATTMFACGSESGQTEQSAAPAAASSDNSAATSQVESEQSGQSLDDIEVNMPEGTNEITARVAIDMADRAFAHLAAGELQETYDMWDSRLQEVVPYEDFAAQWEALLTQSGDLLRIIAIDVQEQEGYVTLLSTVECENMKLRMLTATEGGGDRFLGFQFTPLTQGDVLPKEIPAGVREESVTVGEGTDFPLKGKLTLPESASQSQKVPAVVLINGSGASDMDEQVYAYAPFRDIAYGLAEKGIAVLRYDKRSFSYPSADYSTVQTEVVDDALLALELLKGRAEVDSAKVFIVGHSMGGMLAPRIDLAGGNSAGMVLMASSPFNLGEVALYQSEKSIEASKEVAGEEAYNQSMENLAAEKANLEAITQDLTEVEARGMSAFGIGGYYLQDFMAHDHLAELKQLQKPTLIIQGENDTQVYLDRDFATYQQELGGANWAELKSYPGLNHFFAPGSGDPNKAYEEYMTPGEFDPGAIGDIADFVLAH